jgi:hypothetical protein
MPTWVVCPDLLFCLPTYMCAIVVREEGRGVAVLVCEVCCAARCVSGWAWGLGLGSCLGQSE